MENATDLQDGVEWTETSCHAVTLWHLDSAMPHSTTGALDWQPSAAPYDLRTHRLPLK